MDPKTTPPPGGGKVTRLIIFAREPKVGRVKTRLLKNLTPPQVSSLYKAFIKDVLNSAKGVPCDQRVIFHTGSRSLPFLGKFKKYFDYQRQKGTDLGQRMHRAFVESHKSGFRRTVIIGADSPHIDPAQIKKAFHQLGPNDAVIGPARDGGYYLLGLKRPVPLLFSGIRWGKNKVLGTTLKRADKLKLKVYMLPRLRDIDTLQDLKIFSKNKKACGLARNSWRAAKNIL